MLSVLLPLPLWCLAWATLAYWRAQPPPQSGFAGVGWFFGILGLFGTLVIATCILGPLSFGLGVAGLWAIRARPDRLRGRWLARVGIGLSLGICILVGVARQKVKSYIAAAEASARPSAEAAQDQSDVATVDRLMDACARYADKYGVFPPDAQALRDWVASTERGQERFLPDYVYCGAGLTNHDPYATPPAIRDADHEAMLVFIRRTPSRDGRRLVGIKRSRSRGCGMFLPEEYLPRAMTESNKLRLKLQFPPVDFREHIEGPITAPAPSAESAQP